MILCDTSLLTVLKCLCSHADLEQISTVSASAFALGCLGRRELSSIMVMLSQLLRFKISDDHGGQAKLSDLSVDLLEGDHPPVTCLYFVNAQAKEMFNSLGEGALNRLARARDQGCRSWTQPEESTESMAKAVLLGAGILDALVLDLQNRRATRANDLLLEEQRRTTSAARRRYGSGRDCAAANRRAFWSGLGKRAL